MSSTNRTPIRDNGMSSRHVKHASLNVFDRIYRTTRITCIDYNGAILHWLPSQHLRRTLGALVAETCTEKREQAMTLIRLYCRRPFRDHGTKRSKGPYKGWHLHDWGHVVQRVFRTFHDLPLDIPSASLAAKLVRSEFPNRNDWEKRVNSVRAQARMLELIERGIAPFSPSAAAQSA